MSMLAKIAKPPVFLLLFSFIFPVSTSRSLIRFTIHVSFAYCLSHFTGSKTFELLVYFTYGCISAVPGMCVRSQ